MSELDKVRHFRVHGEAVNNPTGLARLQYVRWCVVLIVGVSGWAAAQQAPLELVETGFRNRVDISTGRGVTLRQLRRAFPEYRVVRQTREAEAGGTYEAICMSRWGRDRRCRIDWTMSDDHVRRIQVFEPQATVDGMRIGDTYAEHAELFSQCFTETGLIHALMCELHSIPDGYAVFNLEPAENHDPPLPAQLDNARIEWFEVSFNTES